MERLREDGETEGGGKEEREGDGKRGTDERKEERRGAKVGVRKRS